MKDIVSATETRAIQPAEPTIMEIVASAVQSGRPPAELKELFELVKSMKAAQAKAEFAAAFARFKSICPPVERRTPNPQFKVDVNGVRRDRMFASLDDIERTVRVPLGECGLSFRWSEAKLTDGMLSLSCIVSHSGGHSEASSVLLPVESKAGCSEQQKFGIVMTYAQRYSLVQALGLTTCDVDEDGNNPGGGETITPEQAANLELAVENVGGNRADFLAFFGAASFEAFPASKYAKALQAIEKKRGKAK